MVDEGIAAQVRKLHLEPDDIILVSDDRLMNRLMQLPASVYRNYIVYAPDCTLSTCKIDDLRATVAAYDAEHPRG